VAGSIRVNYEKYLYPYEIFLAKSGQLELKHTPRKETSSPGNKASPAKCKYGLRQNKRRDSKWEDPDYVVEMDEEHPEFKKLAFTCPGPKNAFAPLKRVLWRKGSASSVKSEEDSVFTATSNGSEHGPRDPAAPMEVKQEAMDVISSPWPGTCVRTHPPFFRSSSTHSAPSGPPPLIHVDPNFPTPAHLPSKPHQGVAQTTSP